MLGSRKRPKIKQTINVKNIILPESGDSFSNNTTNKCYGNVTSIGAVDEISFKFHVEYSPIKTIDDVELPLNDKLNNSSIFEQKREGCLVDESNSIETNISDSTVNSSKFYEEIGIDNRNDVTDTTALNETNPSKDTDPKVLAFNSPSEHKKIKRGLGTWKFDAIKRKRFYVALTGERCEGRLAIKKCKEDLIFLQNPSISSRSELKELSRQAPLDVSDIQNDRDPFDVLTWGVPEVTAKCYKAAGITRLFEWQLECLCSEYGGQKSLSGANLVYSAPTSGGKTMVAELLMLRAIGLRGGLVLFVVPFISLAEEKTAYFQKMWADLHIGVRALHGDDGGTSLTDDLDVAVCTIERANVIVTQLLEAGREDRISLVVVDEVHLIGDSNRGFLLEVMLSKLRYTSPKSTQIVAMSATLPNIDQLAAWLGAALYVTTYRPVNLTTRVCFNRQLYSVEGSGNGCEHNDVEYVLDSEHSIPDRQNDPDGLLGLVHETLRKKGSVLVFCPSKRRCEVVAERIVQSLQDTANKDTDDALQHNEGHNNNNIKYNYMKLRFQVLSELRQSPVGLCPLLRNTIPFGVAHHHAGLCVDERKIIENAFRSGAINVLVATSTLAAGVNLPANRVIIREATMGQQALSVANFKQMCGRAGRMLLDTKGEAVLMVENNLNQKRLAIHLCTSPMDPLMSTLHAANGGGLEKLLLEMICCRRLRSYQNVLAFVECTLMCTQRIRQQMVEWTNSALKFLADNQFIVCSSQAQQPPPNHLRSGESVDDGLGTSATESSHKNMETSQDNLTTSSDIPAEAVKKECVDCSSFRPDTFSSFAATPLGRATALSGISPKDAIPVLLSLQRARVRLILRSGFHPIFLITPPYPNLEPRWTQFETVLDALLTDSREIKNILEHLGADFGEIISFKSRPPTYGCEKPKTCFYRRLYSAVILFSLVQEVPLNRVARVLDIKRGQIQQLQKDAAAFCGMATVFCKALNWSPLATVLESFSKRLSCGVRADLLPLTRLGPEMPAFRARSFLHNGISSPSDILKADIQLIVQILMDSMPFQGKDPLRARLNTKDQSENNKDIMSIDEESQYVVCLKLAHKLQARARDSLQEEFIAATKLSKL